MCVLCDGYTLEQARQHLDLRIRIYGWTLQQVEAGTASWSYTIGLRENFEHPELVAIGLTLTKQAELVTWVATMISEAGVIDHAQVARSGVEFVPVHDAHLGGSRFAVWADRYGHPPPPGSFLQVVAPSGWFCAEHAHSRPRFDQPGPLPAPGPNRAARRAGTRPRRPGGP